MVAYYYMKKSCPLVALVLTLTVAMGISGCAPVIWAVGAGVVGGYAVSRDTVEGTMAKGQDELWDASSKVAAIMGTINASDRKSSEMTAMINGANVTITIIPVNLTTSKLRVKARKAIFPRIGVAQEVYTKILNQLER